MIYSVSIVAVIVFTFFVGATLALSFYLGSKTKSSAGYFAAHGEIPWFINGIAFAGDYLSAASFLGICGMIAFWGYDGFLYSIGYLAGWIVALFVIAEPMKRMGKYTFADALDSKFNSRSVKLVAGISTLVVSIFYLIPQMVGAGALITPLLNLEHWHGVVIVGVTVTLIVVMAGMVSTTYVQFIKGSLLVIFSFILTIMIFNRGFEVQPGGSDGHKFRSLTMEQLQALDKETLLIATGEWEQMTEYIRTKNNTSDLVTVWKRDSGNTKSDGAPLWREGQMVTKTSNGKTLVNGQEKGDDPAVGPQLHPVGFISKMAEEKTGPVGPFSFFSKLNDKETEIVLWEKEKQKITVSTPQDKQVTTIYFQRPTPGSQVLRPGEHPKFKGIRSNKFSDKLNFLSLMLALFCGTASLPHILIRYYTVKDGKSARKSTIVGIATIGIFYVLTLYLGLGAMTSGSLDVTDTNMAAPLLAKSMSELLFAIISAIAFTTVLGTVSGLIIASSGAVVHDLVTNVIGVKMNDREQIRLAKITCVVVGAIAIVLGILFKGMNVSYLVGWAFNVAASANLPALVMILFWKKTTKQGVTAAILVGMFSSLGWILLSGTAFTNIYSMENPNIVPFDQPAIVTVPLGFMVLIVVSLLTGKQNPKTVSTAN